MPALMELTTTLGEGVLRFKSMSAVEEVSRLFEFEVIALAADQAVAVDDLLGTPAAVSLQVDDAGAKRWFHGIVAAAGLDGVEGRLFRYRLTLRPWVWLLTRSADLRIFQEKTAADIVKEVLGEYTGTVVDELSGTYATRPFCVQYRETDFNFVSRLMEDEGIFYYFRHEEGEHKLVLADAPTTHVAFTGFAEIAFHESGEELESSWITRWGMHHEIQPGKVTMRDYNFTTPADTLQATKDTTRTHAEASYEVYDYPGGHEVTADGTARAEVRMHEHEGRFARIVGEGNTPGLAAGCKFTLLNHPRDDQNAEHVVLATQIDMELAGHESGTGATRFRCRFEARPAAEPFRPARLTRKPVVGGPQTAVVVGAGNDDGDIVTDEHARVKVQFHWDRLGQKDSQSSCWIRVASPLAGNGWGFLALPRVGQEVVIDFLEGDPDRPLITGRVHNATQKPPYVLPDNATVSTWKSRSKQGAAADFNEIRFDDKAGDEYMLLHAQKRRIEFVEGNLLAQVGVGTAGDDVGNEHRTVLNNRKEKIEGEYHLTVVKDVKQKVDGEQHLHVVGKFLVKGDDVYSLHAGADLTAKADASLSLESADDMHLKIGGNLGADAATNVHIKGGSNVVIEAMSQLTLKTSDGSCIVLGNGSVAIVGPMVKINSGGSGGSGNGASPVATTDPTAPEAPTAAEDPLASAHR
jgi:type VI secretion system secreted protein VgrG